MTNGFSKQDFEMSKYSYDMWESEKTESVDEYALRRRKIELCALVRKIIETDFDEKERQLIELRLQERMRVSEIAKLLGVHKTTVYRRLEKIEEKLYDKLKYAVSYRYGSSFSKKAKNIVKNCDALRFCDKPDSIAKRIGNLRLLQCFTEEEVSEMTGIKTERLKNLETVGEDITALEISKLSLFYKVSSDFILFGKGVGQ